MYVFMKLPLAIFEGSPSILLGPLLRHTCTMALFTVHSPPAQMQSTQLLRLGQLGSATCAPPKTNTTHVTRDRACALRKISQQSALAPAVHCNTVRLLF